MSLRLIATGGSRPMVTSTHELEVTALAVFIEKIRLGYTSVKIIRRDDGHVLHTYTRLER